MKNPPLGALATPPLTEAAGQRARVRALVAGHGTGGRAAEPIWAVVGAACAAAHSGAAGCSVAVGRVGATAVGCMVQQAQQQHM